MHQPGSTVELRDVARRPRAHAARQAGRAAAAEEPEPAEAPNRPRPNAIEAAPAQMTRLGVDARPGRARLDRRSFARRFGVPAGVEGVVVSSVDSAGPIVRRRHRRGRIILEINRRAVHTAAEYERVLGAMPAGRRRRATCRSSEPARRARPHDAVGPSRDRRGPMKARILVVDDDAGHPRSMRMILEYEGYECLGAASGAGRPDGHRARAAGPGLPRHQDARHGRPRGARAASAASDEALPVIMISGHGTVATAVEATKLGAFDFIEKPFESERVLLEARNALGQGRLRDENRTLRRAEELRHQLVGESAALRQVMDAVRPRGADQRHGAAARRERRRQGARRARHPPQQPAQPRAVRAGQLRRHPRRADRVGAVRPREGLVHRRHREADRQVRAGRRRHASSSTRSAT